MGPNNNSQVTEKKPYSIWNELENLAQLYVSPNYLLQSYEALYDQNKFAQFISQFPSYLNKKYLVSEKSLHSSIENITINLPCRDPVIILSAVKFENNNFILLIEKGAFMVLYRLHGLF